MKRITTLALIMLLMLVVLANPGCRGEEPDLGGKYINPEGGKLELKANGAMSVIRVEGVKKVKGTYKREDDKLNLYTAGSSKKDEPLMTFEIGDGELIDVAGLIWVKQPEE